MPRKLKKICSIFIMFLLLTSMNPLSPSAAPLFKDVKAGHWAASSIEWAYGEGLTSGYPDGTFAPERPITEAQFVSLLVAFDCSSQKSFAANPGEHKASGNYRYLQQRQIPLNGYYNTFMRDQPVKKGQAARIIAAYRGYDLSEAEAVQFLYRNDLANGATGKNDYQDFSPKLDMTRAEAVVLLHRLSKQGICEITGLSKRPTGSDNSKNPTPPNFKDDDTVVFQPKPGKPSATLPNGPANGQHVEVDIEKKTLIANGVDSTLVTLSLLDCYGNPIAYEDSLSFNVTSSLGATLDDGQFYETTGLSQQTIGELERIVSVARDKAARLRAESEAADKKAEEARKADNAVAAALAAFKRADEEFIRAEAAEKSALANEEATRKRATDARDEAYLARKEANDIWSALKQATDNDYVELINKWKIAEANAERKESIADTAEAAIKIATDRTNAATAATRAALDVRTKALEALATAEAESTPLTEALEAARIAKVAADNADAELRTAQRNLSNALDARKRGTNRGSNINTQTDGPELSVLVTAPRTTVAKTDTLTFKLNGSGTQTTSCFSKPITVQLDYVPQAELRLEYEQTKPTVVDGVVTDMGLVHLTAKIVQPGGQLITNYNGRVYFRSAEGAILSNQFAEFYNGVARTTITPPRSTQLKRDVISAEIDRSDSRYASLIGSIATQTQSIELVYEAPLRTDASCSIEDMEVAFILDGSGSMVKNDRERLRVAKSEEFIDSLKAKRNIGTGFNSKGYILDVGEVLPVKNSFFKVGQRGGTNIGDGLEKAFNQFKSPPETKKVAILLTDGKSSEAKVLAMLEEAKKNKITIYTIGLGKGLNEKLLKKIASETGGHYFHVEENKEIGAAYQAILSAITCGTPPPTCGASDLAFSSPSITRTGSEVLMFTEVREGCGEIAKVVVRFHSSHGTVDYQLYGRGQDVFRLDKPIREITNFDLYTEGEFLAFDRTGKLVGVRKVPITYK